jgi:hypothetical protein
LILVVCAISLITVSIPLVFHDHRVREPRRLYLEPNQTLEHAEKELEPMIGYTINEFINYRQPTAGIVRQHIRDLLNVEIDIVGNQRVV